MFESNWIVFFSLVWVFFQRPIGRTRRRRSSVDCLLFVAEMVWHRPRVSIKGVANRRRRYRRRKRRRCCHRRRRSMAMLSSTSMSLSLRPTISAVGAIFGRFDSHRTQFERVLPSFYLVVPSFEQVFTELYRFSSRSIKFYSVLPTFTDLTKVYLFLPSFS